MLELGFRATGESQLMMFSVLSAIPMLYRAHGLSRIYEHLQALMLLLPHGPLLLLRARWCHHNLHLRHEQMHDYRLRAFVLEMVLLPAATITAHILLLKYYIRVPNIRARACDPWGADGATPTTTTAAVAAAPGQARPSMGVGKCLRD
ncbi:hypothetical protein C8R44DRAFT_876586 [Mycena epipterygia]|nr:hypothetical protein C8R44DRAFT_876586 [Mycena epipterygia]